MDLSAWLTTAPRPMERYMVALWVDWLRLRYSWRVGWPRS